MRERPLKVGHDEGDLEWGKSRERWHQRGRLRHEATMPPDRSLHACFSHTATTIAAAAASTPAAWWFPGV